MSFDMMITSSEDESGELAVGVYKTEGVFTQEDVSPPMLRLGQGLSPEVQEGLAKPGQWLLSGYTPQNALFIVPIAVAKRRELRNEMDVVCSSGDSLAGVGTPGGSCASCEKNLWAGEGAKRRPPECSFFYSYMVYIFEHNTTAILNFKKTAVNAGRTLNSIVARSGFGTTVVSLASQTKSGPKGTYQIPSITPTTEINTNEVLLAYQTLTG